MARAVQMTKPCSKHNPFLVKRSGHSMCPLPVSLRYFMACVKSCKMWKKSYIIFLRERALFHNRQIIVVGCIQDWGRLKVLNHVMELSAGQRLRAQPVWERYKSVFNYIWEANSVYLQKRQLENRASSSWSSRGRCNSSKRRLKGGYLSL